MSNSNLVNYTLISPNSNPRKKKISKITIHHAAGKVSVETLGRVFASPEREASANYGVDSDGRVGLYVEEHNRSWASSNADNDHMAVTIEVANDEIGGNWHVSDKALAKLIDLCVDICQRNGIARLNYTGDKTGNLTMHKWFVATVCPGPYLESKFPYIAEQVNKRLGVAASNKTSKFAVGDEVKLVSGATYVSGLSIPNWLFSCKLYVREVQGDNIVISTLSSGAVTGVVNKKYLTTYAAASKFEPYKVKVTVDALNVRAGAGINYRVNTVIRNQGVYTIVEEKNGFGKLKSGAGWISLSYTTKI